ncbi:unnamed protein product [Microthlaspi erraticum]|uniref:DUF8039 domain-containing protein n=1 Tax=Microthlaspi erraticum TaxID=1685480 RepID=A0A6D2JL77_9BRAS|nr:unnamed protein product [Microthlaspi erraticum]
MDFVNNIPLRPTSVKVSVDTMIRGDAFLWRPAQNMYTIAQAVGETIAWPQNCVVSLAEELDLEDIPPKKSSPHQHVKEDKKCRLLDISGRTRVVAEGRWSSNNPEQLVHFVPLGPNAVRVWVDVVKVNDAAVWKPTSAIECTEDAIGTTIAWPENKVVVL